MAEQLPSIDRSLWRYYLEGGKGFAARGLARSAPGAGPAVEREALLRAARALHRQKTPQGEAAPAADTKGRDAGHVPPRHAAHAAERASQALLGMLVTDAAGRAWLPVDPASFRARIEALSVAECQRLAGFLAAVRTAGEAPVAAATTFATVEQDLARRGISLQLSARTNNVYVAEAGAQITVAGADGGDGPGGGTAPSRGPSRRRSNLGFMLGRMTRNFILGH